MSDDFKEKLKAYTEGRLSNEEKFVMEEELHKLELYQEFLDEQLQDNESEQAFSNEGTILNADKIIRKGKWKARLQNGFIALILLFIFLILAQVITTSYYNSGNPSKNSIFNSVITSAIETTNPNPDVNGGGFSIGTFFSDNVHVSYSKKIGNQDFGNGQLSVNFVFSKPTNVTEVSPSSIRNGASFINPKYRHFSSITTLQDRGTPAWKKLEMLPEGTVTEAFVTFDKLYETDEVFKKLENKNLRLLWLAVDTGLDDAPPDIYNVIGFPHNTFQPSLEDRRNPAAPAGLDPYRDGVKRNENFIKTLEFLNKYKAITKTIAPTTDIESALNYVNKNGVKIYGVTVTGPTKELLKLKDESYVGDMNLGETELWAWD